MELHLLNYYAWYTGLAISFYIAFVIAILSHKQLIGYITSMMVAVFVTGSLASFGYSLSKENAYPSKCINVNEISKFREVIKYHVLENGTKDDQLYTSHGGVLALVLTLRP